MKSITLNPIALWAAILTGSLVIGLGIQLVTAYTEPPGDPKSGTIPGPITTGAWQVKKQGLVINNDTLTATPWGLLVSNGKVGIGLDSPLPNTKTLLHVYNNSETFATAEIFADTIPGHDARINYGHNHDKEWWEGSGANRNFGIGTFVRGTDGDWRSTDLIIDWATGAVGINTDTPTSKGGQRGYLDAKDVWLRDANGGAGAWASNLSGGGAGPLTGYGEQRFVGGAGICENVKAPMVSDAVIGCKCSSGTKEQTGYYDNATYGPVKIYKCQL